MKLVLICVGLFAVLVGCGDASSRGGGSAGLSCPQAVAGGDGVGGAFSLVEHTGRVVTDADFLGRPMLVYFGFTYCTEACPLAMYRLGAALALLPEDQRAVFQPILISFDPERDTPDVMAQYIRSNGFPDALVGLTGSVATVADAARKYGIYYERVESPTSRMGYDMAHSSHIFLMDATGSFVDVFSDDVPPDAIASVLSRHLACAADV